MSEKIAITGGIGSGKSVLSQCIKTLGYPVFSCDEIYKDVIVSPAYVDKIRANFPECVTENGIDRKKLAALVFSDRDRLKTLNNIAHPLIMERLFECMNEVENDLVFAEVPLLFESNTQDLFDKILVVQRDLEQRMESVSLRDGLDRGEIIQRIKNQFDYTTIQNTKNEKINLIFNNGSIDDLNDQLKSILNKWKTRSM